MDLLTPKEVKEMLKVSLSLVYKWADRGQLHSIRIPCPGDGEKVKTMVRFKKDDVLKFIEQYYQ